MIRPYHDGRKSTNKISESCEIRQISLQTLGQITESEVETWILRS
nr:MAG TPA: hypothetical protein [Caudoviricetes sp.]